MRADLHRPLLGALPEPPQLEAALAFLREGDTLAEAIDTGSPGGRLAFTIFGAMARLESDLNRERTHEAYQAARAAGKRWGRPSVFHDPANVRVAKALLRASWESRR